MTKKILVTHAIILIGFLAYAQTISLPPSGDNQKSSITQWIGLVKVTVNYSSPDVHEPNGDDRKGKIWGNVVHYGFIDQGFGTSKAAPWRAGANENTTITFSHDVTIGGKQVKAGTYGLFLAVEKEGPWTWILSSDKANWGSYYYHPESDVVRVQANPQDCEYTEWLTYTFDDRQRGTANLVLQWENKRVGFRIDVPNINDLYVAKLAEELRGTTASFQHQPYIDAANFCAQNKVALEQGLVWADKAISDPFVGRENFNSLSTKAQLLMLMNKNADAEAIMSKAVNHSSATVQDVHQYGRSLLALNKKEKAFEIFKLNAKNHPEDKFTPSVGLARGYTALGDKKNAIKYWELALKNIPESQKQFISFYEGEIKKLKEGA